MDMKAQEKNAQNIQISQQKILDSLTVLQTSFQSESGSTELVSRVKKLDKKWNEPAIIHSIMLNDFTRPIQVSQAPIEIQSISIDKGTRLPSGLSLWNIQLTLQWKTIDDIIDFLTYLTKNTEYAFTLNTINLPLSTPVTKDESDTVLSVSLGMYYYE